MYKKTYLTSLPVKIINDILFLKYVLFLTGM